MMILAVSVPVLALDTSSWSSQSTGNGFSFKVPPTWEYSEVGTSENKGVQFSVQDANESAAVIFGYKKDPQNQILNEAELKAFIDDIVSSNKITLIQTKFYQNGSAIAVGKDSNGFTDAIGLENTPGFLKIFIFIYSSKEALSKYSSTVLEINRTLTYPQ